ncbi:MAG: heme exporter protein CcmB [Anaerolineales bacterium]|nr:heme exporter protein CcmB [Anaerolineales bacterium]
MSDTKTSDVGSFFRPVAAIVWKDMIAELRSKELLSAMLVFSMIVIIVLNFAVELRVSLARETAIGFLWVTIIFSGMLGLNRSLAREKDRGCLDGLLLCPASRGAIYTGKMVGNLVFILISNIMIIPLFIILFGVPFYKPLLLLTVLLGTIGFAGIGTLLSAMAVHTRAREVMLPIILLPVSIPLVLASVRASRVIVEGRSLSDFWPWTGLLVAFDAMLLVMSYLTFDYIVEE